MNFSADRVSGAMNEVIAKTGFIDEGANGTINFPSGDGAPGGNSLLHSFHADVARLADHIENLPHFVRRSFANKTRPRDVVVDGVRRVLFRPDIQQDKIAFANSRGVSRIGFVMRVSAVRVDSHDGRVIGDQIFPLEGLHEPLLHFVLSSAAVTGAPADLLKCGGCYRVDCVASREMGLDLFFAPRGFELRDQIAGANHVLAQPADQLESSAIYKGGVEK